MNRMKRFFLSAVIFFSLFSCKQTPEELAELTAPIVYSLAINAIKQGRSEGYYIITTEFTNLKMSEGGRIPEGEVRFKVSTQRDPDIQISVQYILTGSYIATAIVEIPGKDREQFKVNLYKNAIVTGQADIVESYLRDLSDTLIKNLDKDIKLAVFDFQGLENEQTLFGKRVAESLISNLSAGGALVVERKLLEPLFKEFEFQKSGLTGAKGSDIRKQIGQFLGADALVIGTIKQEKEEIIVNGRIVRLSDGVILSSGQVIAPRYMIVDKDLRPVSF